MVDAHYKAGVVIGDLCAEIAGAYMRHVAVSKKLKANYKSTVRSYKAFAEGPTGESEYGLMGRKFVSAGCEILLECLQNDDLPMIRELASAARQLRTEVRQSAE